VIRYTLLRRTGHPVKVAIVAAFLVSDEASFIADVTISVDGALTAHFSSYSEKLDARGWSLALMDVQR
jgi:hypothetical protein